MQFPKRDKKTGILFLATNDFGCSRSFELFMLRDFILYRSAIVSLRMTRQMILKKKTPESIYITLHHVHNFRRKLYSFIKKYKGTDLYPSFQEYCELNLFELNGSRNAEPNLIRLYLREIFDVKAPLEIRL